MAHLVQLLHTIEFLDSDERDELAMADCGVNGTLFQTRVQARPDIQFLCCHDGFVE